MRFLERVRALKVVLLLMFVLGFTVSVPSSIIPMLQQEIFVNNSFITTGVLSAVKGFLGFVYLPLIGSFTDVYGRKWTLLLLLSLSVIPYALMLAAGFWVYSIANVFLGLYDAAMTLMMTITTDCIPSDAKVRTESFALVTASFFFGISVAPFLGAFLTTTQTFLTCAGCQLGLVALTWGLLSNDQSAASTKRASEKNNLLDGSALYEDQTDINKCPFLKVVATDGLQSSSVEAEGADESRPADAQIDQAANGVQNTDNTEPHNEVTIERNEPANPVNPPTKRGPFVRILTAIREFHDLRVIIFVVFWNSLTEQMFDKMLLLYLSETLNFGATDQAIVIAILGVGGLLGLLAITPFLKHFFGTMTTLRVGMVANAVVSICYTFATKKWEAMGATALSVLGMGVFPAAAAVAASTVDNSYTGIAQGLIASVRIVASGISPLAYGFLFQATQYCALPGSAFLVGAGCVVVSLVATKFFSHKILGEPHH